VVNLLERDFLAPVPQFPERALHSCTGQFNIQG